MLDTLEEPLSKNMLIKMNKILKRNTTSEDNPRYNITGLKEYDKDKSDLIDTCLHSQDIYEDICNQLLNFKIENDN